MNTLTVFGTAIATATLPTANKLAIAPGGSSTTTSTTVGTARGYGELYSQGTSGAWARLLSIGGPSGHGFLWDVSSLEGYTFSDGSWAPTLTLATSTSSLVADILLRMLKYNAGSYAPIGLIRLAAQAITMTPTVYTLPTTSLPDTTFYALGDKLYLDSWLNITSPASDPTTNVLFSLSTSGSAGVANALQVVTPGYVVGSQPAGIRNYVLHALGGPVDYADLPAYSLIATGRDGIQIAIGRDGVGIGEARDGIGTGKGR